MVASPRTGARDSVERARGGSDSSDTPMYEYDTVMLPEDQFDGGTFLFLNFYVSN